MPHINITTSATARRTVGSNAGSCGGLVDYLEKENRLKAPSEQEYWFNQQRDDIRPHEVRQEIDANTAKLKKTEAKFYLINISPSQQELQHLGNDPQKLKAYARGVMVEYAANFQKGLGADDVKWYGKVEYQRAYKWTDAAVREGIKQRGEEKAGLQMHVQIIVSRKDMQNQRLLSPLTNHRGQGKSPEHGQKFGQFNRVAFKERSEAVFDQQTGYRRELAESFRYQNTMINGTTQERVSMLLEGREAERSRQQQKANLGQSEHLRLQAEQARKADLAQQQEGNIQLELELEPKRSRGFGMGM